MIQKGKSDYFEIDWVLNVFCFSFSYEVMVSEGNSLNETTAHIYSAAEPPFIFDDLKEGVVYSFAVRLRTNDGYSSILSEVNTVEVPTGIVTNLIR